MENENRNIEPVLAGPPDESLENQASMGPVTGSGFGHKHLSPFRFDRLAFAITAVAFLVIVAVGLLAYFLIHSSHSSKSNSDLSNSDKYSVSSLPTNNLEDSAQLKVGQVDKLAVNGQLKVSKGLTTNSLILSPTTTPNSPVTGQFYFDQAKNEAYYYNGKQFVPVSTSIQGISGSVSVGGGISLINSTLVNSGVISIQGQTGAVNFASGSGIAINGSTINNTGVLGISGNPSQLAITSGSDGQVQLQIIGIQDGGVLIGRSGGIDTVLPSSGGQCLISDPSTNLPVFGSCTGQTTVTSITVGGTPLTDNLVLQGAGGISVVNSGQTITIDGSGIAPGGDVSFGATHTNGHITSLDSNGDLVSSPLIDQGTGLQVQASTYYVDLFSSGASTLTVKNSLGSNVANLTVTGVVQANGGIRDGNGNLYTFDTTPSGTSREICYVDNSNNSNCPAGGDVSAVGTPANNRLTKFDSNGDVQNSALTETGSSLQVSSAAYSIDLQNSGSDSTLSILNSDGTRVANLNVEGWISTSTGFLQGTDLYTLPINTGIGDGNGGEICFVNNGASNCPSGVSYGTVANNRVAYVDSNGEISTTDLTFSVGQLQATTASYTLDFVNNSGASTLNVTNSGTGGVANLAVSGTVTATGGLVARTLTDNTASGVGNDLRITSNNNNIIFSINGGTDTFTFQAIGETGQKICTDKTPGCATGTGQAVILENGSGAGMAQTASNSRPAIWINKNGGTGNIIQLQAGGVDAFVVNELGLVNIPMASGLTLGKASTNTGKLSFKASGNSNTVDLTVNNATNGYTLTLPTAAGTSGQCLSTTGGGVLTFSNCLSGGGGNGVTAITDGVNSASGTVTFTSNDSSVNFTVTGSTVDFSVPAGATGVTSIGNIDTQTKSANGAVILGSSLYLQTADGSAPGLVSTGAQTFAGDKTFTGNAVIQGSNGLTVGNGSTAGKIKIVSASSGQTITIDAANRANALALSIPAAKAGETTDEFCLKNAQNCQATGSNFIVNSAAALQTAANFRIQSGNVGNPTAVITALTSQTANLLEFRAADDSTVLAKIDANGNLTAVGGTFTGSLSGVAATFTGALNGTSGTFSGSLSSVGVNSGSGLIQGSGGLTVAGTVTLSGLGSGVVHSSSGGVLSSSAVVLGTDTSGNYVANLGTLTGLSASGNSGSGSTPALSVLYGATANTAVQGNTTLTCPSGTGNLTGGGTSITLGSGGTCGALDLVNSPVISGTLDVRGSGGLTLGNSSNTNGVLKIANSTNSNLILLQGSVPSGTGNATLNIPVLAAGSSYEVCYKDGSNNSNCSGSGGGITGSGTTNYVARFTGTSTLGTGKLYDDNSAVYVGATSGGGLFNVGSTNQFQVSSLGAVTAVGVNSGTGSIQGSGGATITGSINLNATTAGTTAIGSTAAGTVNLQSGTSITLDGAASATYAIGASAVSGTITLGGGSQTGTITVGQSTASNTINLGNATVATGNIGTINIGTSAAGTGKTAVTIGSTNSTSTLLLQGGTSSGITLTGAGGSSNIATLFKPAADSTQAVVVQNAAGTGNNVLTVDTTNKRVGINVANTTTNPEALQTTSINASSYITTAATISGAYNKNYLASATINPGDVVVYDTATSNRVTTTTTPHDSRVAGVYGGGSVISAGSTAQIVIGGSISVNADATTRSIALGDQLVTSSTTGRVMADNNATTGVVGIALSTLSSGTGTVTIAVNPVGGQYAPRFQNASNSTAAFQLQNAAGTTLLNYDTSNSIFSVNSQYYTTGTISQTGTAVTGSGTTFTNGMIGGILTYSDGTNSTVTGWTDSTHITVSVSKSYSGTYALRWGGLNVKADGSTLIQPTTNSATALDVQDNGGTSVLTVDTANRLVGIGGVNTATKLNVFTSGTTIAIRGVVGTGSSGDLLNLLYGSSTVFKVAAQGATTLQNNADSTAAMRILTASGKSVGTFDTSGGQFILGDQTATGVTGKLVFNTTNNSNSITLQAGATSSTYSLTLPTALGTANQCLTAGGTGTESQLQFQSCTGGAFINGGNSFGAAATLGTNDNFGLNFETNNITRVALDTSGNLQFQQASTINTATAASGTTLTIKGGDSNSGTNVGGNLLLQGGAGASTGASGSVIVRSNTNNSASAFQVQNASSSVLLNADTTNMRISVGNRGTATGQLYVAGNSPTGPLSASNNSVAGSYGLAVQGRYAYATPTNATGLIIYDVSNPAASPLPVISSTSTTSSANKRVKVQGKYAYVAGGGTLQVFDISNPKSPSSVGSISYTSGTNIPALYVQGRYAYVGDSGTPTLYAFDVSNPAAPVLAGSVAVATTSNGPLDIYVQGRYAYLANGGTNRFQILDVSNPAAPSLVSTVTSASITNVPTSMALQGRYAYVGTSAGAIYVIDVSDPGTPAVSTSVSLSGGSTHALAAQGRYLYAGDSTNGLIRTIDISTPASATLLSGTTTANSPLALVADGRYVYAANNAAGVILQSFDFGGAYTQQLEAGGIETDTLSVRGNTNFASDVAIQGSLGVGTGLQVAGNSGFSGAVSIQNTNSNALQIKNGSGTTVVNVDTSTSSFAANGSFYSTGTISQIGTAVTGSGTAFNAAMVGGTIFYNDGTSGIITAVASSTSLTSSVSKTVSSGSSYSIGYGGFRTLSSGATQIQTTSNSTTGFQVQNASGTSLLTVDTTSNNLVTNGTFDSSTSGWSLSTGFGTLTWGSGFGVTGGGAQVSLYNGTNTDLLTTPLTSAPVVGQSYTATFSAKKITSGTSSITAFFGGGSVACSPTITSTVSFTQVTCTRTITSTNTNLTFQDTSNSVPGFYIDNVTLMPTGASLSVGSIIANATITGVSGSGTNTAGSALTLAGGSGTGTAAGGDINLQIAKPGSSGSTVNLQTTVVNISGSTGAATFKNATDSTAAFQIQNSSAQSLFNVDTSNGIITVGSSSNGATAPWTTQSSNLLPQARDSHGVTTYNGYIYVIGGNKNGTMSSTVMYAKVNADGSTGAWSCQGQNSNSSLGSYCGTTPVNSNTLPAATSDMSAIAYGGYLYSIGGYDGTNYINKVYVAKINADGSTGAWSDKSGSYSLPLLGGSTGISDMGTTVYNGWVYLVGGHPSSGSGTSDVYYAKLGANGTIGAWQTSSGWVGGGGQNRRDMGAVVINGYLYVLAGNNGATSLNIFYGKINGDGTLSGTSSTAANSLNIGQSGGSVYAMNGYIYVVGYYNSGVGGGRIVQYSKVNTDGSVGAWSCQGSSSSACGGSVTPVNNNTLPTERSYFGLTGITINGYMYVIGGTNGNGSNFSTTSVYYTSTQRLQVNASLDLVGGDATSFTDGGTSAGSSGGSLTAGNTRILGTLDVQSSVNLAQDVNIGGILNVAGDTSMAGTLTVTGAATFSSTISVTGDATFRGHIITAGTTIPSGNVTLATGSGGDGSLGTTGTCTVTGNDSAGQIKLTPGGSGITNGPLCYITFTSTYGSGNLPRVIVSPVDWDSSGLDVFAGAKTPTQFVVGAGANTLVSGKDYYVNYWVVKQ